MTENSFELTIEGLAAGGDGVGRVDGRVCFVPLTAPGDRVRCRVTRRAKRALYAELVELIEPGAARVADPGCALFGRCGGCHWRHVSLAAQREAKGALLARALGLGAVEVLGDGAADRYRRVARLHLGAGADGARGLGFRARQGAAVVPLGRCPVLVGELEAALGPLGEALAGWDGEAEVRLAAGRAGVAAVVSVDRAPSAAVYGALGALVPGTLAGVGVEADGVLGTVAGVLELELAGADGAPLTWPAGSFGQANGAANRLLGETLAQWLAGRRFETGIELFAGAGNLTGLLAGAVRRLAAVELDERAVAALRRGFGGVEALAGDALERYGERGRGRELVVLDPPRGGARELAGAIGGGDHRVVLYVSCDPATLGRDVALLRDGGYAVRRAAGFDMFPQTAHLESAVWLERD